jgi:hypothetical protein
MIAVFWNLFGTSQRIPCQPTSHLLHLDYPYAQVPWTHSHLISTVFFGSGFTACYFSAISSLITALCAGFRESTWSANSWVTLNFLLNGSLTWSLTVHVAFDFYISSLIESNEGLNSKVAPVLLTLTEAAIKVSTVLSALSNSNARDCLRSSDEIWGEFSYWRKIEVVDYENLMISEVPDATSPMNE